MPREWTDNPQSWKPKEPVVARTRAQARGLEHLAPGSRSRRTRRDESLHEQLPVMPDCLWIHMWLPQLRLWRTGVIPRASRSTDSRLNLIAASLVMD